LINAVSAVRYALAIGFKISSDGMTSFILALSDLAATQAFAEKVAPLLRPGDAILLEGELGAGKTAFARALLRALAGDAALEVPSPSYTLLQSYETPRLTLHHYDLWRLDGPDALAELGWDDARRDVVLVEWPDRLRALRPDGALLVSLRVTGETAREAILSGWPEPRLQRAAVSIG
jgi:tRNA threonylcarbamoyladenosine biosynthesis protein TsaE